MQAQAQTCTCWRPETTSPAPRPAPDPGPTAAPMAAALDRRKSPPAFARNTELGAALGVGVGRRVGPCVGWSDSAGMRLGKRLEQFVDAGEGFLKCRRAGS